MIMSISTFVNSILYDIRTISLMWYLSLIFQFLFFFASSFTFVGHYLDLVTILGETFVIYTIAPYIFFGILFSLFYLIIKKDNSKAFIAFFLAFLPTTLLSVDGMISLLMFLSAIMVKFFESSHRLNLVKIVAFFSKEFSPLYQKRFDNRHKYPEYKIGYRLLGLMRSSDFTLLKEIEVTERDRRTGITTKVIYRTFKIKGVPGTTTIKDELFISSQRRWYSVFPGGRI